MDVSLFSVRITVEDSNGIEIHCSMVELKWICRPYT